ncbi:hypothetical protein [Pseudomonas sp.]|uniref:hypothetical protein n=1 Tax=Pseudomonas sp. TaxID=306 RepID=UPI0023578DE5|nr:hypothetical protein [Pseudomonas sp.]
MSPLEPYLQDIDGTLRPDADGLKEYKGRKFADIANDDGSAAGQTVMVAYHDLIKAWRARLPSERTGGNHNNSYDQLIDRVTASKSPIVRLPKGRKGCSNDIVWPVAEHHRP